jgi:hypothetical protein
MREMRDARCEMRAAGAMCNNKKGKIKQHGDNSETSDRDTIKLQGRDEGMILVDVAG